VDNICGRSIMLASYVKDGTDLAALCSLVASVEAFFLDVVGGRIEQKEIKPQLKQASVPDPVATKLFSVFAARKAELEDRLRSVAYGIFRRFESAAATTAKKYGSKFLTDVDQVAFGSELVDFDWQLRMVLSSDSVSSLRTPILLLRLTLADVNNSGVRNLTVELSKAQLDDLLSRCQQISEATHKLQL